MKKLTVLLIIMVPAICGFLNWPFEGYLLTATFGESRFDHFHNGIDLGGGSKEVHPVKQGTLIYYFDESEHPFLKCFGNGNVAVLEHKNKERSFYYHLKSVNKTQSTFSLNDVIGVSGATGRSIGTHLHVSYKKGDTLVNPLHHFSKIEDTVGPTIASIYILTDGRLVTVGKEFRVRGVFDFELMAKVYDTYEKIRSVAVLGIYKIAFYIDDRLAHSYQFDKFTLEKGRLVFGKKKKYDNIFYNMNIYRGGKFKNLSGKHKFTVQAWDMAGNSTSRSVRINFR